jgi:hypothetical protein
LSAIASPFGNVRAVRFFAVVIALTSLARADVLLPPDPPRWRLRAALTTGVGGARDAGDSVTVFPTTLELGVRLFGPLSVTVGAQGVLVGEQYDACGKTERPNAILGAAGLRVDFANGRSASWAAPFVEAHAGVGRQGAPREVNGVCDGPSDFFTGGAKLGVDVWLGKVAVTVVATWDWLPTAMPFGAQLGASFVLY